VQGTLDKKVRWKKTAAKRIIPTYAVNVSTPQLVSFTKEAERMKKQLAPNKSEERGTSFHIIRSSAQNTIGLHQERIQVERQQYTFVYGLCLTRAEQK
jgi:hypothetical protein